MRMEGFGKKYENPYTTSVARNQKGAKNGLRLEGKRIKAWKARITP